MKLIPVFILFLDCPLVRQFWLGNQCRISDFQALKQLLLQVNHSLLDGEIILSLRFGKNQSEPAKQLVRLPSAETIGKPFHSKNLLRDDAEVLPHYQDVTDDELGWCRDPTLLEELVHLQPRYEGFTKNEIQLLRSFKPEVETRIGPLFGVALRVEMAAEVQR
jgi:hypothetical protein